MAKEEGSMEVSETGTERLGKIVDQITAEGREGSVVELQGQINYLDHVAGNPTKSMDEALAGVYKSIEQLGGYVTHGVSGKEIEEVKKLIEVLVERGIAKDVTKLMLEVMIGKVEEKVTRKEVPDNCGILIVFGPDMEKPLVAVIPRKVQ